MLFESIVVPPAIGSPLPAAAFGPLSRILANVLNHSIHARPTCRPNRLLTMHWWSGYP